MLRGPILRVTAMPVALMTFVGACYRYVPEPLPEPVPGGAYRGILTPEGSAAMERVMGVGVIRFDGRILTGTDTAFLVAMSATVKRTDPRPTIWSGEEIVVPRAAVQRFEHRELDRAKTLRAAVLYGVGIVASGALWFSIRGKASGSPSDGTGGPPP